MRAPLFSPEGYALLRRGPVWREHPAYYAEEPPEDVEAQQHEDWLLSLPEAEAENDG